MSKASVQFVEMVREAAAQDERVSIRHYCLTCGRTTVHVLTEARGKWERYTCDVCGDQLSYCVR